jgi:tRNA nucleotidyltransferase (CCA-adding enzyme)
MSQLTKGAVDAILSRGKLYEVGGSVRDRLLTGGGVSSDHDYLVTGIPLDDLTEILKKFGRVDLVGKSFGVIKFTQFERDTQTTFDITLPRTEFSTGPGHKDFNVTFDHTLRVEDDLVRRDFTVNAIAMAVDSGKIIDPLGGQKDLENKILRIVYPTSFEDDPLRMVRGVQFSARFRFCVESNTLESMTRNAKLINSVSPERIAEELNKLLTKAAKPSAGFRLMQKTGLLKEILPELELCVDVDQPGGFHKWNVFEHTLQAVDAARPELKLRMALLLHDINKPQAKRVVEDGATFYGHEKMGARTAKKILHRLKYSNDFTDEVVTLVDRHMFTTGVTDKGLRRLVRRVGVPLIFDLLDVRRADVVGQGMGGKTDDVDRFEAEIRAELERQPPFSFSDLALDGGAIMELFAIGPGPTIGRILHHLMERVLDNPELNTTEALTAIAREYYAQGMPAPDIEEESNS